MTTATAPPPSTVDPWFVDPMPTDVFAAWGQWAGGLGSLLAVIVALVVVGIDIWNRRSAEKGRRVGRARTVIAGVIELPHESASGLAVRRGIEVANHGQEPVLEVVIENIEVCYGASRGFEALPGDKTKLKSLSYPVLAGGKHVFHQHKNINEVIWGQASTGRTQLRVTFTFLDSEGYRWRRVGNSAPTLLRGRSTAQRDDQTELSW